MEFRKKPVVIEAFQFQRRNNGPVPYPDWYEDAVTRNDIVTSNTGKWHDPTKPAYCLIQTLEGTMRADEGDWIIRGIMGEIYPCKPDIFAATYENATPSPVSTAGGERQSIGRDSHFWTLMGEWRAAYQSGPAERLTRASAALIAHIDTWAARSAGDALPAGWKPAPMIPDADMLRAGMRYFHDKREPASKAWKCYRDMLGAAPAPGNTAKGDT
jgi:hypothetical protein